MPANLMTFRVPCRNAHSPAKFMIEFDLSGVAKVDSDENEPNGTAKRSKTDLMAQRQATLVNKDLRIFVS